MADLAATVVLVAVSTIVVAGTVAAKAMVVVASQNFSVRCVLSMATLHRFVFFGFDANYQLNLSLVLHDPTSQSYGPQSQSSPNSGQ